MATKRRTSSLPSEAVSNIEIPEAHEYTLCEKFNWEDDEDLNYAVIDVGGNVVTYFLDNPVTESGDIDEDQGNYIDQYSLSSSDDNIVRNFGLINTSGYIAPDGRIVIKRHGDLQNKKIEAKIATLKAELKKLEASLKR